MVSKVGIAKYGFYQFRAVPTLSVNKSLVIIIDNNDLASFKIEFEYAKVRRDPQRYCLKVRRKSGNIEITVDKSRYNPEVRVRRVGVATTTLFLAKNQVMPHSQPYFIMYNQTAYKFTYKDGRYSLTSPDRNLDEKELKLRINKYEYDCRLKADASIVYQDKPFIFYDFNNPEGYLRNYGSKINHHVKKHSAYHFFYYYKDDGHRSKDLVILQSTETADARMFGLSAERPDGKYFIDVLESLLAIFQTAFRPRMSITIVSQYGEDYYREHSKEFNKALEKLGMAGGISFLGYSKLTSIAQ